MWSVQTQTEISNMFCTYLSVQYVPSAFVVADDSLCVPFCSCFASSMFALVEVELYLLISVLGRVPGISGVMYKCLWSPGIASREHSLEPWGVNTVLLNIFVSAYVYVCAYVHMSSCVAVSSRVFTSRAV